MKANELRIGNLIKDQGGKLLRIDWLEKDKVCQEMFVGVMEVHPLTEHYNKCQPIPLTEEWLLKFRFKPIKNEWFEINYDSNNMMVSEAHCISINIESYRCSISFVGYYNENGIVPFPNSSNAYTGYDIQYVHQLQNLYFALSGEELTIKS